MNIKNEDDNLFKKSEKLFRKIKNLEDFEKNTINFKSKDDLKKYDILEKKIVNNNENIFLYEFKKPEGFIIIKNFISEEMQLEIGKKSLNEYINKPHRTNLFIYEDDSNLTYKKEKFLVKGKYNFNKKIRWSNLGYQFDWDNRKYVETQSEIPKELNNITQNLLKIINYDKYKSEAILINYYGEKDNMGGHIDDGEPDQINPIISYSLGLSCIFLIGSEKKNTEPLPVKLDSGDVCIMSKNSRICYHGVPKIIKNSFNKEKYIDFIKNDKENENPDIEFYNNYENVSNYFSENRLNINIRQVFN